MIKMTRLIEFIKDIKSDRKNELHNELFSEEDIKIVRDEIDCCDQIISILESQPDEGKSKGE